MTPSVLLYMKLFHLSYILAAEADRIAGAHNTGGNSLSVSFLQL